MRSPSSTLAGRTVLCVSGKARAKVPATAATPPKIRNGRTRLISIYAEQKVEE